MENKILHLQSNKHCKYIDLADCKSLIKTHDHGFEKIYKGCGDVIGVFKKTKLGLELIDLFYSNNVRPQRKKIIDDYDKNNHQFIKGITSCWQFVFTVS